VTAHLTLALALSPPRLLTPNKEPTGRPTMGLCAGRYSGTHVQTHTRCVGPGILMGKGPGMIHGTHRSTHANA